MFSKTTLENGLSVVFAPMAHVKSVTVLVMVKAGSKYETKNINGISHFLEHMFFKGTVKRPTALAISESLDAIGGEYNAFTSKEYTGYYAKVDSTHLDLALDVVSDILLNSLLDEEEIEKEKGVIVEEMNMYYDAPMRYIHDVWERLLYGNDQPAGWDIIGTKEIIQTFTRDDLIQYLNKYYVAQGTVIFIAGDIGDQEALLIKVKMFFAGVQKGDLSGKQKVVEKQSEPRLLIYPKTTDQTQLALGFRAYDIWHKDIYVLKVLSVILGGGMSSRLFTEIREKRGLAYCISSDAEHYTDSGYFVINAGVKTEQIIEAIQVILLECQKIVKDGVSESELIKAKDYIRGKLSLGLEVSDQIASYLAIQEILQSTILLPEEYLKLIDKVTVDDLIRVSCDIFRDEKLNLAIIGPFEEKDRSRLLQALQ
jgi:predicted Zn-dependent peptidase